MRADIQNLSDEIQQAVGLLRRRLWLEGAINTVIEAEQELSDSVEMIELAEMEDDSEMVEEAVAGLDRLAERMRRAQQGQ